MDKLPVYERHEKLQDAPIPDFQSAGMELAKIPNVLGSIGAHVAQEASHEIARQMGYNLGQNPQGDIGLSLTEFDKHFSESYNAQAANTLGLEAQKMFETSQLEMSKAIRLSPDLIDKNNAQLLKGVDGIVKNAPLSIKGKLDATLKSQILSESNKYYEKMYTQQREDTRQQYISSVDIYTKQGYELAYSGEQYAAEDTVKTAQMVFKAAVDNKYFTPREAEAALQNVKQSVKDGMASSSAAAAERAGQFPQFAKRWAEQKPEGWTQQEYENSSKAILNHYSFLNSLKSQQNQINVSKFQDKIYENVNAISQADISALRSQVNPVQYEQLQLEYIKQKKIFNKQRDERDSLIQDFTNKVAFARSTESQKNDAFYSLVDNEMKNVQIPFKPKTRDEAELSVALNAGGAVPAYVKALNTRLASTSPADIELAGQSIALFFKRQKGANLDGLDERALAMYNNYQILRRALPADVAAQEAYKSVYNQTLEEKKIVEDNYHDQMKTIKNDVGQLKFFTTLGGIDSNNLVDPLGYVQQAESLFKTNYKLTKGNLESSKTMTSDMLKNMYSESHVNGRKETTYYPLEQAVGIPADGVGLIQDDIIEHVNKELKSTKEAYDKGDVLYYWEVEPRNQNVASQRSLYNILKDNTSEGSPIRIFKHWKNGTRETHNLIVKANPWNTKSNNPAKPYTSGWDVVVSSGTTFEPLFRENPLLGDSIVYKPDIQKIQNKYFKEKGLH